MALILSSIDINQCNALDVFTQIAGNMLADGERNWGRLVVVFVIAAHTCNTQCDTQCTLVICIMSNYYR